MENKIRPLTLIINKEIWDRFKATVPRDVSLNDSVVYLITNYLNNKEVAQYGE